MISFTDWNKKKDKNTEYEIVKSRSGLPMFILPSPDLTPDDDDREVEVITDLEIDEPVNKDKSIPQMVSDFISSKSH